MGRWRWLFFGAPPHPPTHPAPSSLPCSSAQQYLRCTQTKKKKSHGYRTLEQLLSDGSGRSILLLWSGSCTELYNFRILKCFFVRLLKHLKINLINPHLNTCVPKSQCFIFYSFRWQRANPITSLPSYLAPWCVGRGRWGNLRFFPPLVQYRIISECYQDMRIDC